MAFATTWKGTRKGKNCAGLTAVATASTACADTTRSQRADKLVLRHCQSAHLYAHLPTSSSSTQMGSEQCNVWLTAVWMSVCR